MPEKCKKCKKEIESGIWESSKFKEQRIYLFCSEKCRDEFIKARLEKIKIEYPDYYQKIMKDPKGIDVRKVG
jgi:ribosomal protein L24E